MDKNIIKNCKNYAVQINDLNLSEKENFDRLNLYVKEELKNAVTCGLEDKTIEKTAALCLAVTKICAKERGVPEVVLQIKANGGIAQANGSSITWNLNDKNGIVKVASILNKKLKDMGIFSEKLEAIKNIFAWASHEVEHVAQFYARGNLEEMPSEAVALDKIEGVARTGILANYYDFDKGHDAFVFEKDANAAETFYAKQKFMEFVEFAGFGKRNALEHFVIENILFNLKFQQKQRLNDVALRFGWEQKRGKLQSTRPKTLLEEKAEQDYWNYVTNKSVRNPVRATIANFKEENKQMGDIFDYSKPPKKGKDNSNSEMAYEFQGLRERYNQNLDKKSLVEKIEEFNKTVVSRPKQKCYNNSESLQGSETMQNLNSKTKLNEKGQEQFVGRNSSQEIQENDAFLGATIGITPTNLGKNLKNLKDNSKNSVDKQQCEKFEKSNEESNADLTK